MPHRGLIDGKPTGIYIAANHNFPEEIVEAIKNAIEKLHQNRIYQELINKWTIEYKGK